MLLWIAQIAKDPQKIIDCNSTQSPIFPLVSRAKKNKFYNTTVILAIGVQMNIKVLQFASKSHILKKKRQKKIKPKPQNKTCLLKT